MALIAMLYRWAGDLSRRSRGIARLFLLAFALLIAFTSVTAVYRIADLFPNEFVVFTRAAGIVVAVLVIYSSAIALALRRLPAVVESRRSALKALASGAIALPLAAFAIGYSKRNDLQLVEADIEVPNLPPDLQGLRIVQLTDIHLSPLVNESLLARAVDMANEARGAIAIVTGDLVTRRGDPLDACLNQLARLRSDAGTFGCLGNHEIYADAEEYTTGEGRRRGLRFLRSESQTLRFGNARLNLAGVDYQRKRDGYLHRAQSLVVPGATNVLLSHNPDVFRVAANQGFDITLSGHTHGGQVNFEMIHPALNIARFYTPYVHGLYELGANRLYVSRGVGTIGIPARIGAPPEVAILRLCAI